MSDETLMISSERFRSKDGIVVEILYPDWKYLLKKEDAKIKELKERIEGLSASLKKAIKMITGEYCSHYPKPCSSSEESCYAQEFYKALETFGEGE